MTPGIRAIVFDLDGCLVDSEPLSLEAVAAEIRAAGLPDVTAEAVGRKYLGVTIAKISSDVSQAVGRDCSLGFADRIEARLFAEYTHRLERIDGVIDLLDRLKAAGIRMSIASGSSSRRLARTLEIAGLSPYFEGTAFSADLVAQGKPAPDVFLLAARAMGVEPASCAVLEDSPHGIAGAVAAGMRAIGFVGGSHLTASRASHRDILMAAGATAVIDHLSGAFAALTAAPQAAVSR